MTDESFEKFLEENTEDRALGDVYQDLLELSTDTLTVIDKEGTLVFDSPMFEDMLGYEQGDMRGENIFEFIHPEDQTEVLNALSEVFSGGENEIKEVQYRFQAADGSYKWLESRGRSDILDETDGVIVSSRDITETIEAREHAEFLNSLLSHDLSNSLQVAMGNLELLEDRSGSEGGRVDTAERSLERMKSIIEDVGTVRKASGSKTYPVNLNNAVIDSIETYETVAADRGIDIQYDLNQQYTVMAGDLLNDLINNLIENSIEHSNGEVVRIELDEDEDYIILGVEDNGEGVPDYLADSIFDEGVKGKSSSGTGMGTYIVKHLVDTYDGKLEYTESDLGGSRFEVYLEKPDDELQTST